MKLFKKCCCCFGLQTGALIIGWLGVVSTISGFFYALNILTSSGIDDNFLEYNTNIEDYDSHKVSDILNRQDFIPFVLGMNVVYLIMNISLIWGAYKKKKFFIIPWLATTALEGVVPALVFILIIVTYMVIKPGLGIILFCILAPIFGFYLYIWLCVLSFYHKLREEELLNVLVPISDMNQLVVNNLTEDTITSKLPEDKPPAYDDIHNV